MAAVSQVPGALPQASLVPPLGSFSVPLRPQCPSQPALHHRQVSLRSLLDPHSLSPLHRPHLILSPPQPCPTPCAVYRSPVPPPGQSSLFPYRAPHPVRSLPHPQPCTPRPGLVPSTLESLLPTPSLPWLGRSPKPCRAPPDTLVHDPSPLWPLKAPSRVASARGPHPQPQTGHRSP